MESCDEWSCPSWLLAGGVDGSLTGLVYGGLTGSFGESLIGGSVGAGANCMLSPSGSPRTTMLWKYSITPEWDTSRAGHCGQSKVSFIKGCIWSQLRTVR